MKCTDLFTKLISWIRGGKIIFSGPHKCGLCGFIYDSAQGDPYGGAPPHAPFENLPADWVCPICGSLKDKFTPVN